MKRTYNLSERTVRTVRELSEEYQVANSQDADGLPIFTVGLKEPLTGLAVEETLS